MRSILSASVPLPRRAAAHIEYLTQIHLDSGVAQRLREECVRVGLVKPLVISDAGVRAAGVLDRAPVALGDIPHAVFDGAPSNPTEAAMGDAAATHRAEDCDGLIAVGGGSSIGPAKGVAIVATHDGPLFSYATIEGGSPKISARVAPLAASWAHTAGTWCPGPPCSTPNSRSVRRPG